MARRYNRHAQDREQTARPDSRVNSRETDKEDHAHRSDWNKTVEDGKIKGC